MEEKAVKELSFKAALAAVLFVGPVSAPATAQRAVQMVDIVGLDSDPATRIIRNRGFDFVDSRNDNFRNRHTYWWNDRANTCIHVVSFQGRIIRVSDGTLAECRKSSGTGTNAASLYSIIGQRSDPATRTLRAQGFEFKDDHSDQYNNRHTYWWNNRGQNCVHVVSYNGTITRVENASDGECGQGREPEANDRGEFGDLIGIRSSSGMDQLARRGFVQVDNFTSGNARYSIQYRLRSRQCIQVTQADGRFTDVRDIGSHPKCNREGMSGGSAASASSSPVGFSDLQGVRSAGGMSTLEQRGFRQVDNFTSGNARYSIQWRPASRQCLQVTIADGRFEDIRDIGEHPNCR